MDTPRQVYGSALDGNMARKSIHLADDTARITQVDEYRLKRFRVVLRALSSKYELDADEFEEYAKATKCRL